MVASRFKDLSMPVMNGLDAARVLKRLMPTIPLIMYALQHAMGDGKLASAVQLVVGGIALLGGYLAIAHVLRIREVSELVAMIRGRLGR